MSTLYVIRHGQASYGQPDYDKLSPLGIEQARALGEYLRAQQIHAVYAGPRVRQRDTAKHLALDLPVTIVEGLDEYPAEVIFRQHLAETGAVDLADAALVQRHFERAVTRWASAELTVEAAGSFADFAGRVRGALREIMTREGRRRTICVVTSAGPVACTAQLALELSDTMAMKTSWVVANSSVSELKFREDSITLVSFNTLPHLREPRLVTYR